MLSAILFRRQLERPLRSRTEDATPISVAGQRTGAMRSSPKAPSRISSAPPSSTTHQLPQQASQPWEHSQIAKATVRSSTALSVVDPTHDRLLRALSAKGDDQVPSHPPFKSVPARRDDNPCKPAPVVAVLSLPRAAASSTGPVSNQVSNQVQENDGSDYEGHPIPTSAPHRVLIRTRARAPRNALCSNSYLVFLRRMQAREWIAYLALVHSMTGVWTGSRALMMCLLWLVTLIWFSLFAVLSCSFSS